MMGVSQDPLEENYRFMNICKNKKQGGPDQAKRNEMFHLLFHGDTGRYD
jgi:hypothetical protein